METRTPILRSVIVLTAVVGIAGLSAAHAQKNVFTNLNHQYTEDFSVTMNSSQPRPWADNSTLVGWYGLASGETPDTYIVSTGAASIGGLMAFGPGVGGGQTSTAFGMLTTNTVKTVQMALQLVNNTGGTLTSVTVSFDQVQWYGGNGAANDVFAAAYRIGGTEPTGGSYTLISALDVKDFTSGGGKLPTPVTKSVTHTIEGIEWQNGETLWLRWTDSDVTGGDAGAGFSNMTITVPEPATTAMLGGAAALLLAVGLRRRLRTGVAR